MRKMKVSNHVLVVAHLSCFLGFSANLATALSQDAPSATSTSVSMPSNPGELMLLATKSNSLLGTDMQPWHLKATFKLLDDQGNSKSEGTIEQFWAGQHKSKIIYTVGGSTQTTYWTETGELRSGPPDLPPNGVAEIRNEFVAPIPAAEFLMHQTFEAKSHDAKGAS